MGKILNERYELGEQLGRGGMGEVWSATDPVLGRQVAVKLLQSHLDGDDAASLFFREARSAGALSHPGVVTVFDLGRDSDGTLFLVMELVKGRDLGRVLREDGIPSIARAVEWATQIADALNAAHQAGIVHRDLKPANLMLTPAQTVKVLDFGIARRLDTAALTSTRIMGTLAYMPPERFNTGHQDARGDLYALGCVLHELLTGVTPFGDLPTTALMFAHVQRVPDPPSAHRDGIPAVLDTLVAELLAKDPAQRPESAAHVGDLLRSVTTILPEHGQAGTQAAPTESDALDRSARLPVQPVPTTPGTQGVEIERVQSGEVEPAPNSAETGAVAHTHPSFEAPPIAPGQRQSDEALPGDLDAARAKSSSSDDEPTPANEDPIAAAQLLTSAISGAATPTAVEATEHTARSVLPGRPTEADRPTRPAAARQAAPPADPGSPARRHDTTVVVGPSAPPSRSSGSRPSRRQVLTGITALVSAAGLGWAFTRNTNSGSTADAGTTSSSTASATISPTTAQTTSSSSASPPGPKPAGAAWTYSSLNGRPYSTVISGGIVYVGTGNGSGASGPRGSLYAFEASKGSLLWQADIGGWMGSAAAVSSGSVFAAGWDGLYAFDAQSGKNRWVYPASGGTYGGIAHNGITYFLGESAVHAVDAASGGLVWKATVGGQTSPMLLNNGVLFVGGDDGVYAFDAATGARHWKSTKPPGVLTLALTSGVIAASCNNSSDSNYYALDAASGRVLWQVPSSAIILTTAAGPGAFYVNLGTGVSALDATTGSQLWSSTQGFTLALARNELLCGGQSLTALDPATGSQLWQYDISVSWLATDADTIYTSSDAAVTALR